MRILGIDPGLASTGAVVIEASGEKVEIICREVVRTSPRDPTPARLAAIWEAIEGMVNIYSPHIAGIETAFVRRDTPQSGLSLGKVLGVILLLAHRKGLDVAEVTPREVKETLTGYGNASKEQVEKAVTRRLGLAEPLKPSHLADAAAVALTAASFVATLHKR